MFASRGLFPLKAMTFATKNGAGCGKEPPVFGWTYGNSENATIRARLRAEAMSKAVSSMIAILSVWTSLSQPGSCSLGANSGQVKSPDHGDEGEYPERHRHEFGIVIV
jgi:hypothetical protein